MYKEDLLHKATMTVETMTGDGKGGKMLPKQFNTFLKMMLDKPTLLSDVRRVIMDRDSMQFEKIGFAERILRPGVEATPLSADQRAVPKTGKIEMTTKEVVAEINISYDALLENVMKEKLYPYILGLIAERCAVDLEDLLINGDTESSDPFLKLFDGVLKKTKTGNAYDAKGVGVSPEVMMKIRQMVPSKYQRNLSDFKYYASPNIALNYVNVLGDRFTNLGDAYLSKEFTPIAYGVPIKPTALIKEEGTYNSANNVTDILYCNPKNLLWGVQKDITVETDKDIRAGVFIIVVRSRIAFNIEEPEAIGRGFNILPA